MNSSSSFVRLLLLYLLLLLLHMVGGMYAGDDYIGSFHKNSGLVSPKKMQMFVDDLPDMPKLKGYGMTDGVPVPGFLTVGMFEKKWRFHRDLPLTTVFAYGTSKTTATIPGPTIESLQGIMTRVKWENHLPEKHILPWDPTITTAETPKLYGGVPTVVHLHGAITAPSSDGNSMAWFTKDFKWTGPNWSREVYTFPNVQPPGNLWYHDHAMGLTRVNLLAGLVGAYVVRDPKVEDPLGLPSGTKFDRHLVVFDRSFRVDGSIYMNSTGNNPDIHPQWQPEYFGDAIVVNGKAWPKLQVQRRKYRFRILNASNARFFRFFFANSNLHFTHVGSDSLYLPRPWKSRNFVLAPSEIADVVVDFSQSASDEVVLSNDAPFPYPTGDPTDEINGKVMKFVIEKKEPAGLDKSRVPLTLLRYPRPDVALAARKKRYVAMYEYQSSTEEPTHLYLNGKPYTSPVTETPTLGSSEMWDVINLTEDNHPLHVHLGLFVVLEQRSLSNLDKIKNCMMTLNDAVRCHVEEEAFGRKTLVPGHERGWKNVYKMQPGYRTRIVVRFSLLEPDPNASFAYPFDATAEPGYVYHCHILDHEDNEMMRPLKLKSGDHTRME